MHRLSNLGHNITIWRRIGNVGFEHCLYQVLIAYNFRNRGLKATIEKALASGREVDVYVEGRERIGIEIELTTTNIEEKIRGIDELDRLIILVKAEQVFRDFFAAPSEQPK